MSFQALHVAATSLRAQQKAMDITSHNIANVNTDGYSRQIASIVTASPDSIGTLDFGRGVNLNNIQRVVDPLIKTAQRENASQFEFWDTVASGLQTVESTFGSLESTGLAASVDDFFLSWQQLANNPQDIAQKYNVRTKSEALTTQLNRMQEQLGNAQQSLNGDIDQQIAVVNLQLDKISALTQQIKVHEAGQQAIVGTANDLRDQRDEEVRKLAKIIPLQEVVTNDGHLLLQTKGGDLLTQDGMVRHLARSTSTGSNGFQSIVTAGSNNPVQGLDEGGSLGGLLSLRDERMQGYMTSLDSFAANLAFATNQIHGSAGGGAKTSTVQSALGATNPALALNDTTQGVAFAAQVQAGSFNIHVYDDAGLPQVPTSQFTVTLAAGASMNDVATAINDPILGVTGVNATVDAAGRLNLDAGTNTIAFADDTSNFLAAYEVQAFFHGSTAGNLELNQSIKADVNRIQTGRIDPATSLIQAGENTAAIDIMGLQDFSFSFDGSAPLSLHERISVLSQRYGLDVEVAEQQKLYRSSEASSLAQQREAISGVNIDEELIAMLKFQRAYEASAKVITTSNQMMDALMGMMR
ncbi:MAG: flagellar hook-associated protein FlgK [Mariprofundaceae bacterium]|nr:flagellar hook-associated protein FlgK [Mariprofundaceae bacterium]